jgi:hypothetical protein
LTPRKDRHAGRAKMVGVETSGAPMKKCLLLAATLLATAAFASPPSPAPLKGEVLEILNVEGYTYLRLKTKQGEAWAAVPTAPMKEGAQVTLDNAMPMENFESKTLGRKFDRIYFASLAGSDSGSAPMAASPHGTTLAPSAAVAKVPKARGANARTVAEVVGDRAGLSGKPVTIAGQVVKVNSGILGKNWIHLQDGSGSAAAGTHDILVTTKESAAVGDVVTASGTVRTDVKVGPGYAYAVLVEDARLRK